MNDLLLQGAVTAIVVGAVEGWRRASLTRGLADASSESEARTRGLGGNLGPRVERVEKELAELRGAVSVLISGKPPAPTSEPDDPPTPRRRPSE